jgi:hypothetical protein
MVRSLTYAGSFAGSYLPALSLPASARSAFRRSSRARTPGRAGSPVRPGRLRAALSAASLVSPSAAASSPAVRARPSSAPRSQTATAVCSSAVAANASWSRRFRTPYQ